jgi:hypothetical protein
LGIVQSEVDDGLDTVSTLNTLIILGLWETWNIGTEWYSTKTGRRFKTCCVEFDFGQAWFNVGLVREGRDSVFFRGGV